VSDDSTKLRQLMKAELADSRDGVS
jgi:hypothetical protein